jgi:hypothetical protein
MTRSRACSPNASTACFNVRKRADWSAFQSTSPSCATCRSSKYRFKLSGGVRRKNLGRLKLIRRSSTPPMASVRQHPDGAGQCGALPGFRISHPRRRGTIPDQLPVLRPRVSASSEANAQRDDLRRSNLDPVPHQPLLLRRNLRPVAAAISGRGQDVWKISSSALASSP